MHPIIGNKDRKQRRSIKVLLGHLYMESKKPKTR